jgi:DNA-binding CsgD family transcriptional regulator/tetratricopeptide (TPR) repeat protein
MLRAEREHVAFRHELARIAIEASLPADRRRVLNRRVLELLPTAPSGEIDVARLAHHAEAAGAGEAVLRFAREAAELAASLGAHAEAADQYARALRFGNALDPGERARLLESRAQACLLTDQNVEAIAALQGALALYRELGDKRGEANALRQLSTTLWCPGRVAEAEQAGQQAVELLDGLETGRELGLAYANMAMLARDASDSEAARSWGTRTLAEAESLDDVDLRVAALMAIGEADMRAGQPSGRTLLEQTVSLAEENGLTESVGWIEGLLGRTLLHQRLYPEADTRVRRALAYMSERGFELGRQYLLAYLAQSGLEQGRWAEAEERAAEVLRVRRVSTAPRILALVVTGLLRARRGEPDPWEPLDEARALGDATGELMRIGPVGAASAEAAWLAGRHDEIVELTDAAYALALKRRDPWLAGSLAVWRSRGGLRQPPVLDLAEPYSLELAGASERAADAWTGLGCPYEAALARLASEHETELRRSLVTLQDLGARPAAAIVARQLRNRGARGLPRGPRPATRRNPAGLTPRQHEVLVLLARGLRNGEIAERLFVSVKTVDHHVASIMRKLDVHTCNAATSVAIERGLVGKSQDR